MKLIFFIEERSAKELLETLLKKIAPTHESKIIVFEGKQDLEKNLEKKLKAWFHTDDTRYIVMRDKDSGDCRKIKSRLKGICTKAGKPDTLIRIACHELEAFYLGDLAAVSSAFNNNVVQYQNNRKFRQPDKLANAAQELRKLVPQYQKISGSREIAKHMNINSNRSHSFNVLVSGIRNLIP